MCPPGPADVRFVWEKNGRELEMCVPVQTHALPDGRAHMLSWLRDAIRESAEYRCSVVSSVGSQTSHVKITVMRPGKQWPPPPPPLQFS